MSSCRMELNFAGIDIRTPIVAAPMAFASTAELAAAVTAAGGLGFFGAGTRSYSYILWKTSLTKNYVSL